MNVFNLSLKNVGPFADERITFIPDGAAKNTITIITGENGSGKSIILDAIKGMIAGFYSNHVLSRRIIKDESNYKISMTVDYGDKTLLRTESCDPTDGHFNMLGSHEIHSHIFAGLIPNLFKKKWIIDYWTPKISSDKFNLESISKIHTARYLADGISGIHNNMDVVQSITFFDYLAGSQDNQEKQLGTTLFSLAKDLVNESLNHGEFSHISRINLQPVVNINGVELTLEKLSTGNLYLIQRLLSLVYKAYSAFDVYGGDPTKINEVEGLLLIDEIETHLHPKWQKKILGIIRRYFPNIQIILTTHSPFIVSSLEDVLVFVCKMEDRSSIIVDETDQYKNMPVEEIIRTPIFQTDSFSESISTLLAARKTAIENNEREVLKRIEAELYALNPTYFRYFKLDDI